MSNAMPSQPGEPHLSGPEDISARKTKSGAPKRRFFGIAVWATAVVFAALAAIMYLLMFALS